MKTTEVVSGRAFTDLHLAQLVDQMDSSIGEATTVMGAMVQEIIRRSLRGGVLSIGRELHDYVGEQVALQIEAQTPVIEHTAALTAATRATEVVRDGMAGVERAARDGDEQLAARIAEEALLAAEARSHLADEVTHRIDFVTRQGEEATRHLTVRIDDTARQAEVAAQSLTERLEVTARESEAAKAHLASQIEGAAQSLTERLEVTARETEAAKAHLTSRIEDTARQAEEKTETLARSVAGDIAAAERRALETARAEFMAQLEEVRDRARKAMTAIRDRIEKVELSSADLANLHQELKREMLEALRASQQSLTAEVAELREVNRDLLERVETLERPRGFFAWLFGWSRKAPPRAKPAATSRDEQRERAQVAAR
jgi:hypothetical protein